MVAKYALVLCLGYPKVPSSTKEDNSIMHGGVGGPVRNFALGPRSYGIYM